MTTTYSKFGGTGGPFQTLLVQGYSRPLTLPDSLSADSFGGAACIIKKGEGIIDSIDLNSRSFPDGAGNAAEAFHNLLTKHGAQPE